MPTPEGRLFAVYHEPVGNVRGNVLVVPAHNEEMNRCRSMVTIQAQELARHGIGTLVVDLFGTGESDGQYNDARWELWLDNVRQARAWLNDKPGGCLALLGIRLGVPLALASIAGEALVPAIIAWQPVIDGKLYLTQFMRMRIAGNMDRTDIPKETSNTLRASLSEGKSIEIAGYEIHPEMASALDNMRLSSLLPSVGVSVAWFEKGNGEEFDISPASRQLLDAWKQSGTQVAVESFDGPAFWALHDRVAAPELIHKTSSWMQSLLAAK
ncbi:MAG TPA: hydrolase 2, exosortase A system-associated [Azonexus sp.]|nr:hydrolase 2, exosortase A system-associated [Azonexus sp.]